jgi:hypothetical protein
MRSSSPLRVGLLFFIFSSVLVSLVGGTAAFVLLAPIAPIPSQSGNISFSWSLLGLGDAKSHHAPLCRRKGRSALQFGYPYLLYSTCLAIGLEGRTEDGGDCDVNATAHAASDDKRISDDAKGTHMLDSPGRRPSTDTRFVMNLAILELCQYVAVNKEFKIALPTASNK